MDPSSHRRLGRPVQPADDVPDDLVEFEGSEAARLLAERAADAEIVLVLQLNGFDPHSDEWQSLARALAEYGYSVFKGWTVTGVVRARAAAHNGGKGVRGLGRLPEQLRLDPDDAHGLAAELLITAVETFRSRTLLDPKRTWTIDGGASLKTYFVGRCLMELPDAYERWARSEGRRSQDTTLELVDDHVARDDPAVAVVAQTMAEALVSDADLEIFRLDVAGYTDAEIADMLELSEATVRTRKSRARAAARSQRDSE